MNGATRYYSRSLATVLEAQGRKRSWLARELGVSESLISKISLGQRSAKPELARRIADKLGYTGEQFFLLWELPQRNDSVSVVEQAAA